MIERVCVPWFTKILPIVYDDSLSYMEQLWKLTTSMNEVIENINTIPEQIEKALEPFKEDFSKQLADMKIYVDSETESMRNYVNQKVEEITNEFETFKVEQTERQEEFEKAINAKFSNFQIEVLNQIAEVYNNLDKRFAVMEEKLQADLKEQRDWIANELEKIHTEIDELQFKLPKMLDPTTGQKNDLVNVINNVYHADRYGGFTALQFDDSGCTVGEFDEKGAKAISIDLYGLLLFGKYVLWTLRNPFTGIEKFYKTVIDEIVYHISGVESTCYSCAEFDALELTAEVFDGKEVDSYHFDFDSKTALA